jgi:ABC-type sugar transport system substrate-binding protein
MVIKDILPGQEDVEISRNVALNYLRAHPDTAGVWAMTQNAVVGAAEAAKELGIQDKVAVTGVGPPSCCTAVIKDGSARSLVLWNPVDTGYAAVYMAVAQIDGTLDPASGVLPAGRLGELKFISPDVILLGPPAVFTKDNIDQFDF